MARLGTLFFGGIWNGLFIIIEKIINIKEFEEKYKSLWVKAIQHIYCILIFVIGWVFFRSDSMSYAIKYLQNMFGLMKINPADITFGNIAYYGNTTEIVIFAVGLTCAVPIFRNILMIENKIAKAFINIWLLVLFFVSTVSIAVSTYNPFIYFRF